MAEARAPGRPVERISDMEADADALVLGQEDLDALFLAGIPLPDGRLVTVDALTEALAAGHATVPAVEGDQVPLVVVLDILEKAFAKIGVDGDVETETPAEDGQASFREGMNLIMLGSLFESGRIASSQDPPRPQGIARRGKEKTVDKEEVLRDILVDGPDAGDDIIRPTGTRPIGGQFLERVRVDGDKNSFESAQATGSLLLNDLPGAQGFGKIVSVEYDKVVYRPDGNGQIVIEESGVWRLTITLAGIPGEPGSGYGLYYFEQFGALDHSKYPGGDVADFLLTYTVEDDAGKQDTASIGFSIADSNPVATDDSAATIQSSEISGVVTENDNVGADGPGRILSIGHGDTIVSAAEADEHGMVTLVGTYGTLVFDFDDGYYDYRARADAIGDDEEPVSDDFYYTIADSDGDEDTAGLRITILPGDSLPDLPDVTVPGAGDGDGGPKVYIWADVSIIDNDRNGEVDSIKVIKHFDPDVDKLNIDGLLSSLGYEDVDFATDVFRLVEALPGNVQLQVDLGRGWQAFASVNGSLVPLTIEDIEGAIVA